MKTLLDNFRQR